ncbi:helix-turn-helix transcriptional regulator [Thioclava pacifica]|uniref:Uncharacterized protein n=1 Tax=Thioclava pacifica DSM 10166 TaxID=1353537 RepID=A0A074JVM5_9RHOB|nr:hypothetical protein [Thioclava pacifica]KEO53402.1 hypothetical protein TP2_17885 [Thioclava pacifica DSM 10166]
MSSTLGSAIRKVAGHDPEAFADAVTRRLLELPYGSGIRALVDALSDLRDGGSIDQDALRGALEAADAAAQDAKEILIGTRELGRRYGVSARTVWNTVQHQDGFPKSFRTPSGQCVWRLSEVAAWEDCGGQE